MNSIRQPSLSPSPAPEPVVSFRRRTYRRDAAIGIALFLAGLAALIFPAMRPMVIGILGGPAVIAKALTERLTITSSEITIGIPRLEWRVRWSEVRRIEGDGPPDWRSVALVFSASYELPPIAWRRTVRMISEPGLYLVIPPIWEDMPRVEAALVAMLGTSRSAPPVSQFTAAPPRQRFPMTLYVIVLAAAVAFMLMGVAFGTWRTPAGAPPSAPVRQTR